MRKEKRNPIVEKIRKRIDLKTRLFIGLQMDDIENWEIWTNYVNKFKIF
jgi:hypothetical protein